MALYFYTENPELLLETFNDNISRGDIETWDTNTKGYFTHTARQWQNRAWLKPKIEESRLALYIIPPKGVWISSVVYGVYHGRFVEAMLVHCDTLFSRSEATALPTREDKVKSSTYVAS